jgi:uncharacterized protein (TIGR02145 family)
MKIFNRQGRTLLLAAAVAVGAALVSGAVAQTYDSASVPFLVNVNATVSATDGAAQRQISVTGGLEAVLKLPIQKTLGIADGARRQINAPAIISNFGGKVTVNLPAQSYSKAEVLLYTVNGKRILSSNVSASNAVNNLSHQNLATGVYLLSVKGTDGNIITSRLTHNGGGLNISVAFGGENLSNNKHLAKETAGGDWTITVSSTGYIDTVYTLRPVVGSNTRQTITLRAGTPVSAVPPAPANVTATAMSKTSITVSWSAVAGATKYYVYRSNTSGDGDYGFIVATTSASYINSRLSANTTYYYKVSASNSVGTGSQSAYAFATTRMITDMFTDTRDNINTYKTVVIGGKTWMAENLNFETGSGSWCYNNSADNCAKYGRLYTWDMARVVCPSGWHLPSRQEWSDLVTEAGGDAAGKALKSKSGWGSSNGTDDFDFSALPGGYRYSNGDFYNAGYFGIWWTATEYWGNDAYRRGMYNDSDYADEGYYDKGFGYSVRCVKE